MGQKYWGIMPNDFLDGEGVSVSLWVSGCPHKCAGCHNSEMWDYDSGYDVPYDIKSKIIKAISANSVERNFSVLGGEPLCPENLNFVEDIVRSVRAAFPHIKIYIWSGYTFEELKNRFKTEPALRSTLFYCNYLIDGRYDETKRDITLPLRGSSNQNIIDLSKNL